MSEIVFYQATALVGGKEYPVRGVMQVDWKVNYDLPYQGVSWHRWSGPIEFEASGKINLLIGWILRRQLLKTLALPSPKGDQL